MFKFLLTIALLLNLSGVQAAPSFAPCDAAILGYFPVVRINSLATRQVQDTLSVKTSATFGSIQNNFCSYKFSGFNAFILANYWQMSSREKAKELYDQSATGYQGDKNGIKVPPQKRPLDIGDESILATLKNFSQEKENEPYFDVNTIFTLNNDFVFSLNAGVNVISAAGLEELMRGAVGQRSGPIATSQPTKMPPGTGAKTQDRTQGQAPMAASRGLILVLALGGLGLAALAFVFWRLKHKIAAPTLPPPESPQAPETSQAEPLPPQDTQPPL